MQANGRTVKRLVACKQAVADVPLKAAVMNSAPVERRAIADELAVADHQASIRQQPTSRPGRSAIVFKAHAAQRAIDDTRSAARPRRRVAYKDTIRRVNLTEAGQRAAPTRRAVAFEPTAVQGGPQSRDRSALCASVGEELGTDEGQTAADV